MLPVWSEELRILEITAEVFVGVKRRVRRESGRVPGRNGPTDIGKGGGRMPMSFPENRTTVGREASCNVGEIGGSTDRAQAGVPRWNWLLDTCEKFYSRSTPELPES
jgi:hypothetical protein